MIWNVVLVGAGGFLGAIARYGLSGFIAKRFPRTIPYGTLTVNVLGSWLLGFMAGHSADPRFVLLWGTGFMGAFTTFSTFKLENVNLLRGGRWGASILYTGMSYSLGILLAYAGYIS
ncbi:fluoride efflux transporter CrcB [Paenibacillus hamazuiensis]|uniref:fluoride efflux transporter CrcB n=1 Tax=Paenibacillus hamazuiensis TaxID=2936508 RepID=UPI00200E81E3|nr:fluoride efflux transporter CrcB [Paenibacillus hamazuiensis]